MKYLIILILLASLLAPVGVHAKHKKGKKTSCGWTMTTSHMLPRGCAVA